MTDERQVAGRSSPGNLVVIVGLAAAATMAGLLRYAATVSHHASDDFAWLTYSRSIRRVWAHPSPFGTHRPLFGTWLWLLGQLGVDSPAGFTVAGVVLGALGATVTGVLVARFLGRYWGIFAALLTFVVPARHEAMLWMSAQADGLAFLLIGVTLLASFEQRRHVVAAALFCLTILAMLCKETAFYLPAALAVFDRQGARWRSMWSLAGAAIGTGILIMVHLNPRAVSLLVRADLWSLMALIAVPARLAWPTSLPQTMQTDGVMAGVGIICAIALVVLFGPAILRREARQRFSRNWQKGPDDPLRLVNLGFALIALAVPVWAAVGFARVLTAASAGLAILITVALATTRSTWQRTAFIALMLGWMVAWTGVVGDWKHRNAMDAKLIEAMEALAETTPPRELIVTFGAPTSTRGLPLTGIGALHNCGLPAAPTDRPCGVSVEAHSDHVIVTSGPDCRFRYRAEDKPPIRYEWLKADNDGLVTQLSWPRPLGTRRCTTARLLLAWDGTGFASVSAP